MQALSGRQCLLPLPGAGDSGARQGECALGMDLPGDASVRRGEETHEPLGKIKGLQDLCRDTADSKSLAL